MLRSQRKKLAIGVAGLSGALALGVAVPSLAFGQDPTPSPTPSSSASTTKPDPAADRAKRQDELAAALATELGIDKEKVAAALAKVRAAQEADRPKPARDGQDKADLKTRLAEAVKAGTLTQAEADAIQKAADAGVLGRGGGPGHPSTK